MLEDTPPERLSSPYTNAFVASVLSVSTSFWANVKSVNAKTTSNTSSVRRIVVRTGELSAESFRRTVEATRRFRAITGAMNVGRIDVLATEALRRASNGARLVAAIAEEAGLEVASNWWTCGAA